MIFKTFNSDIDNISSKWGLFGKSFYDVSTDIKKRWNNVSKTLQATNDYTLQNISNAWKMENSNPIKFCGNCQTYNKNSKRDFIQRAKTLFTLEDSIHQ